MRYYDIFDAINYNFHYYYFIPPMYKNIPIRMVTFIFSSLLLVRKIHVDISTRQKLFKSKVEFENGGISRQIYL